MSWSRRSDDETREFFDSLEQVQSSMKKMASLLRQSKYPIIFTGAGISTSAGIPDFRSGLNTQLATGPGLWAAQAEYKRRTNNERSERTKNDPSRPRVDLNKMSGLKPTYTHFAISVLITRGIAKSLLTQNVDNLHRRSGVPRKNLAELHGNIQVERCEICDYEYERNYRIGPNIENRHYTGRKCEKPNCQGWLKDYLVPFGEDLPRSETQFAWDESEKADFCLAIGSSLTVTPACDYAGWVGSQDNMNAGNLCIINIQKTPLDKDATIICHGYCDEAMRALMMELDLDEDVRKMMEKSE